jgi:hypothetical protein
MGMVIQFHARASTGSRAAKVVRISAVTPASLAFSVASTADHHSGGMRLREDHLRTAQFPAPTSDAIASSESHRSMIDTKDVKSAMDGIMGQLVPKIKAIVSHDYKLRSGHNVPMDQDDENVAETAWREAFRQRVRQIQGERSQDDMAELLCISRDAYSKYVGSRASAVPTRLLPRLAKIGAVSLEWLIEGPKEAVKKPAKAIEPPPARKRR